MPKKGGKKKGGKKAKGGAKEASEPTPEELAGLEKKKVIQELKLLKSEHMTELKLTNGFQQAKVCGVVLLVSERIPSGATHSTECAFCAGALRLSHVRVPCIIYSISAGETGKLLDDGEADARRFAHGVAEQIPPAPGPAGEAAI
jgi:hypothetical protein